MKNKDIAIVYMVAGLSSRFGGKIKQFAKVGPKEETLIEYSLNQALSAGFNKIIFIVGEKTEQGFKEMFGNSYKEIAVYYAFQNYDKEKRDRPWGTADALCSAKDIIDCPFVVCNGDDIYGKKVFEIFIKHLKKQDSENKKTSATIGYKLGKVLSEDGSVNRGIFQIDSENNVKSIKEVFDITKENLSLKNLSENDLCSMNIFAFHPEVLSLLNDKLLEFKKEYAEDRRAECLLPNEISGLIEKEKKIIEIYSTDEKWLGITRPEDETKVKEILRKK